MFPGPHIPTDAERHGTHPHQFHLQRTRKMWVSFRGRIDKTDSCCLLGEESGQSTSHTLERGM